MHTFCAMVTVWLIESCVELKPSEEPYRVNMFPLLLSLIEYGSVPLPTD